MDGLMLISVCGEATPPACPGVDNRSVAGDMSRRLAGPEQMTCPGADGGKGGIQQVGRIGRRTQSGLRPPGSLAFFPISSSSSSFFSPSPLCSQSLLPDQPLIFLWRPFTMISARAFAAPARQCLRRVRAAPSGVSPFSQVAHSLTKAAGGFMA